MVPTTFSKHRRCHRRRREPWGRGGERWGKWGNRPDHRSGGWRTGEWGGYFKLQHDAWLHYFDFGHGTFEAIRG
ncbi:hypothetical protein, partial [Nocardia sp. NPDC058244]|uniref:hypothetical protein n=1 Tax=Nocardia sp. NPDC058244 TaxID=3346398 RepID=UPI0036D812AB